MKKRIFYEWSTEDIVIAAENRGIKLTDDDINMICDELEEDVNNNDWLNETIHAYVYDAIMDFVNKRES